MPSLMGALTGFCAKRERVWPASTYSKVKRLHSRAEILVNKLAQGITTKYIDDAIMLNRKALELCPPGNHMRLLSLSLLAIDITTRYKHFGAMHDLVEAIVLAEEALLLCTQGHPDRPMSLNNFADVLFARYERLGAIQDLDEAIVLAREVFQLCPHGHPRRSLSLNNLSVFLSTRYNQLGVMSDLDEAILLAQEALQLRPQGHPGRSVSLSNVVNCLLVRFEQIGAIQDLDEAIILGREALQLRQREHPHRTMALNNLALSLYARYKQLGAVQDLQEAIDLGQEALELRPQGHPDRAVSLNNLALYLFARYEQLGIMRNLDEAIRLDREALQLRPRGHPQRSNTLDKLSLHLATRHEQLGATEDLDEAISHGREALQLRPRGHPRRSNSLDKVAHHLSICYRHVGEIEDLDSAIVLGREALQLRPKGHPQRSESLDSLAWNLSTRHVELDAVQGPDASDHDVSTLSSDLEELFTIYASLADVPHMVTVNDLSASRAWIRAAERFEHPSTLLAYETSLRFLVQHLSLLPPLPQHLEILKNHASSLAVDAFSACLRSHVPKRAVELLEQGRGLFWSQLTRLHSPLDEVITSSPSGEKLAMELTSLTSSIRSALDSQGLDQHERVCHLNHEMQRVVAAIRELPGLSHFLLPSPFSDLQSAANGGPVVIVNASQYGCDVLVVFKGKDPFHIPLCITRADVQHLSSKIRALTIRAKSTDVRRELGSILRELWDDVVSPVVRFLQTTYPLHSRIWWCPTAEFTDLPLHAAGPYRKGQQNLADLYISSYTLTLNTLIHARRPRTSQSATSVKCFVAIGQANATGETKLLSVSGELAKIGRYIDGAAAVTLVEGDESCISRVTEELGKNQWVHLACHGIPNRERPFKSAFAMRDGHFAIERIIACRLDDPEFAYLSACHTTVGDEQSPDEAIHLASAMQFVGFRSVIGTMWAVDDGHTNKISSTFYRHMLDESGRLDHARAAFALNETMRSVDVPLDQRVLYIHLGA